MIVTDVLIIGGGPAGVAAAVVARAGGLTVALAEQRDTLGGAIHRAPAPGIRPVPVPGAQRHRWAALQAKFEAAGVTRLMRHRFLGVDPAGYVMLEARETGTIELVDARAVVLAVGALERVVPVRGSELPGVMTAGALQVHAKRTGQAPEGPILLAGSGPLLVAVGAQLTRLGAAPVAIVERSDPFGHPLAGAGLFGTPGYLAEAAGHLAVLARARVPWLRGCSVRGIATQGERLVADVGGRGGPRRFEVARIGLHDGIRPNDFGLPPENLDPSVGPVIVRTGDCREALGGAAAVIDGAMAGRRVAGLLGIAPGGTATRGLVRHRQAQRRLATVFGADPTPLAEVPDETILCQCERCPAGTLKAMIAADPDVSPREVRLNARIAMGSCQGRFCADHVARFLSETGRTVTPADLTGRRWPVHPAPIGAFLGRTDPANSTDQT